MSDTVTKVSKPQLRSLLHNQIKRNLIVAVGMCIVAAVSQKIFINDARKERFANFYKNYDIDKEFNNIRNKGLFDSCEPDS